MHCSCDWGQKLGTEVWWFFEGKLRLSEEAETFTLHKTYDIGRQ